MPTYDLLLLPGDGIGPEVTDPCLALLRHACRRANADGQGDDGKVDLDFTILPAGATHYLACGEALPKSTLDAAAAADTARSSALGRPK